jgi:hypothetical protein
MAISMQKDEDDAPIEPGNEFPSGSYPLYVFFEYGDMETGNTTIFAWYKDGNYFESCLDVWAWGLPEERQWGERGGAYLACTPSGGWQVGNYEIRVFIDTQVQSSVQFSVLQ